jgi:Na+-driven multidrug efflux pump
VVFIIALPQVATMLIDALYTISLGFAVGASSFISRALGAGRRIGKAYVLYK